MRRLMVACPLLLVLSISSFIAQLALASNEFKLSSPEVAEDGSLPKRYTCDGDSIAPPVQWTGAPAETKSFVLIMDHQPPDGELHWYWTIYDIAETASAIDSGEQVGVFGSNSVNQRNAYAPPCSKGPGLKRYQIHLYALSSTLEVQPNVAVSAHVLRSAMDGLVLDTAMLEVSVERDGQRLDGAGPPREREDKPRPVKQEALTPPAPKDSVDSDACTTIEASVLSSGFNDVTVTCDEQYAYIQSDTYPDHDLMNGIAGTNEQVPVPAEGYAAPIPLHPKMSTEKTTIDAALGVAINGVPIYDYSAQGELNVDEYDESTDTVLLGQLDQCGGHSGRGDDYHYHAKPTCMIAAMDDVQDDSVLGWGYDGYPLFGDKNPDGSIIASDTLDVCNGQADETFGYRYHTSVTPPYVFQCLVGEVDQSVLPRVSPLDGASIRSDLKPPREGVENLSYVETESGSRIMSYRYQGEDYYTKYTPSESQKNCFEFEQKTISNNGAIESGTFCR